MVDLFGASIELIDAGFAVVVAESDGRGRSTQLGITEAGRRYLAEMRALR